MMSFRGYLLKWTVNQSFACDSTLLSPPRREIPLLEGPGMGKECLGLSG